MDIQLLMLQIQSYGLTKREFQLLWEKDNPVKLGKFELPEFIFDRDETVFLNNCDKKLSTGLHSCIEVKFKVKRLVGFYLVQIYFPSLLIITLSWFSFWIDPQNSPARIGVAIFVVLNLTTTAGAENSQLPQVSYSEMRSKILSCQIFLQYTPQ